MATNFITIMQPGVRVASKKGFQDLLVDGGKLVLGHLMVSVWN